LNFKVDHTTVFRWVQTFSKKLVYNFKRKKRLIGDSWYVDETYIEINKSWVYLYRAVDKSGKTAHFYLSEKRNLRAARKFLIEQDHRKIKQKFKQTLGFKSFITAETTLY